MTVSKSDIAVIKNDIKHIVGTMNEIRKNLNGNGQPGILKRLDNIEVSYLQHEKNHKSSTRWIMWIPSVIAVLIALASFVGG